MEYMLNGRPDNYVEGGARMRQWETKMVRTKRGNFEVFTKGKGVPLCVIHIYPV